MKRFDSISRREFLTHAAAVTAASTMPLRSFAQDGLQSRVIPGTNERLPLVGLGSPGFFYAPKNRINSNFASNILTNNFYQCIP